MFQKILIANRGEIALRVIRACKELGISTVAVYSEADSDSMHVQVADEAICIGPGPSAESYLKVDAIMSAAEIANADAIHPGYGFLAENARFAEICGSCNIKFIGPSPEVITMMGDKNMARAMAVKHGVPVTPGSPGIVPTIEEAHTISEELGYPVMIKATAGGGGRGMRPAMNKDELATSYNEARAESKACFGEDDVYIEKLVLNPHHIEFQIIGDSHGNAAQLGERDCSLQRRNQKIIEETPSPLISEELRQRMAEASVNLTRKIGYENCGTIEYLVDDKENFYFMEMNTRIQVEHPITEEVRGCDLIKEQIHVAAGKPISDHVRNSVVRGHSIECRINAEDPYNNFAPSPGKIELFYASGGRGVRVDTHVYSGYSVPPYYDSMIAKLIVTASSRAGAIARMNRALNEFLIEGIKTTIPFQSSILNHPDFIKGDYNIGWVENFIASQPEPPETSTTELNS